MIANPASTIPWLMLHVIPHTAATARTIFDSASTILDPASMIHYAHVFRLILRVESLNPNTSLRHCLSCVQLLSIQGILEVFTGLGLVVGPVLGGVLYSVRING